MLCSTIIVKKQVAAAAAAKSVQSCPTLCDPRDGSPPDSPGPGILQVRTLEWVKKQVNSLLKDWLRYNIQIFFSNCVNCSSICMHIIEKLK